MSLTSRLPLALILGLGSRLFLFSLWHPHLAQPGYGFFKAQRG